MRARGGTTLLELLIALVVTSVALLAGYTAFGALADARERPTPRVDGIVASAAQRRQLVDWLSHARSIALVDDALVFQARDTLIHLHIDRADSTAERGLVAELVPVLPGSLAQSAGRRARPTRLEIARTATALDAEFLTAPLGEPARWVDAWPSTAILPAAVRLRIAVPSSSAEVPSLLAMPITVPLGAAP